MESGIPLAMLCVDQITGSTHSQKEEELDNISQIFDSWQGNHCRVSAISQKWVNQTIAVL